MLICCCDDFIITHRSARLDDCNDTGFMGCIDPVTEREEGIRGHH